MASDKPFRFLDLPAELRCMVYEQLNIETRLYSVSYVPTSYFLLDSSPRTISMAIKNVSTSILTSCRLVYAEAAPMLKRKLEHLRKDEPLHFIVDPLSFDHMFYGRNSLIMAIQKQESNIFSYGKEAKWKPSTGYGMTDMYLDPSDEYYALLLKFIHKCANHTQDRHSNRMLVTVEPQLDFSFDFYLEGVLGYGHQDEWQMFRAIDEVELRLCEDKREVDECVQAAEVDIAPDDYRTHGPWRTSVRAMDKMEYSEIWNGGEKIELV
jgi:hypothetical protein